MIDIRVVVRYLPSDSMYDRNTLFELPMNDSLILPIHRPKVINGGYIIAVGFLLLPAIKLKASLIHNIKVPINHSVSKSITIVFPGGSNPELIGNDSLLVGRRSPFLCLMLLLGTTEHQGSGKYSVADEYLTPKTFIPLLGVTRRAKGY